MVLVVLAVVGLVAWAFLTGTIGFGAVLFVLIPALLAGIVGVSLIVAYRN